MSFIIFVKLSQLVSKLTLAETVLRKLWSSTFTEEVSKQEQTLVKGSSLKSLTRHFDQILMLQVKHFDFFHNLESSHCSSSFLQAPKFSLTNQSILSSIQFSPSFPLFYQELVQHRNQSFPHNLQSSLWHLSIWLLQLLSWNFWH